MISVIWDQSYLYDLLDESSTRFWSNVGRLATPCFVHVWMTALAMIVA